MASNSNDGGQKAEFLLSVLLQWWTALDNLDNGPARRGGLLVVWYSIIIGSIPIGAATVWSGFFGSANIHVQFKSAAGRGGAGMC